MKTVIFDLYTHIRKNLISHLVWLLFLSLLTLLLFTSCQESKSENIMPSIKANTTEEAGKYLVMVAGCNDCHTPGFAENDGKIPESEWLTGSPVGFRGPWGTTYPSNLRLFLQTLSEEEWLKVAHTRNSMPPMPWPSLHSMSNQDLISIYRYIKSLGPKGNPAPLYSGPDTEPNTPYFIFDPVHMERLAANTN
jgi:hypothetical protein